MQTLPKLSVDVRDTSGRGLTAGVSPSKAWRLASDCACALGRGSRLLALGALILTAGNQAGAEEPVVNWLFSPPPLEVEPLIPPARPDDELDRDPGGALVLPNVRVNDSPPGGCNEEDAVNVCAQNETTLAINPTENDNFVAGANDYSGDNIISGRAQSSCGVYTSTDAGET
jgi:hypothetical protein